MWKNIIANSLIVSIGLIGSKAFIFLYRILLARHLSVADYAAFALLTTIFSWLLLFSHFDMHASISHHVAKYRDRFEANYIWSLFLTILFFVTFLSIISSFFGTLISYQINLPFIYKFIFFSGLLLNSIIVISDGFFKGIGKYTWSTQVELSNGSSRFILFYVALVLFPNIDLSIIVCLFSFAFFAPLLITGLFVAKFPLPSFNLQSLLSIGHARSAFNYSKWILATDLSNTGLILLTTLFLSFYSEIDVSQYNLVIIFFSIFQFSFGAIVSVLIPEISNRKMNDKYISLPDTRFLYATLLLIFTVVIALSYFPFIYSIPILIFDKPDYKYVLYYLSILSISIPFKIYSISYKGIIQGIGKTKPIAKISAFVLLFYLIIFSPMYNIFKLNGIIYSMLAAYIIEFFITKIYLYRSFNE